MVVAGAPIIDLSLAPPTHLLLDIQIHVSWGTRLIDLGLAEGYCYIILCCVDDNLVLRHLSNLDLALGCYDTLLCYLDDSLVLGRLS